MRIASRSASLWARMAVIWEPMWKWSSSMQSSMSTPRSRSTARTSSSAERPNFEWSPEDSTQRPAPTVESRERRPICGRMPRSAAHLMTRSSSWKRSITMIGVRPEALGEQRRLDVGAVLVAVADEQRVGRVEQRQRDQQLGLAARLEADAEGRAELDDLLDDVGLLVDLDREHAAPAAAVLVLGDRRREAAREALDPLRQDVREADQHRAPEAAPLELADELGQVDALAVEVAARVDADVALFVDGEEASAPIGDLVERLTLAGGPFAHRALRSVVATTALGVGGASAGFCVPREPGAL